MHIHLIRAVRRVPVWLKGPVSIAAACALSACNSGPDNFNVALDDYLARRGDVCLAMFDWPIDVMEAEAGSGARHAVQLPVLEKLGLVRGTIVAAPKSPQNPDGALQRFELTDAGSKFYKPHPYTARGGAEHAKDFCVARIRRDRIVDVKVDSRDAQHPRAVVSYTYRIDAAPWMQDADARRVFPMVARVIDGAGAGMQLQQSFRREGAGWVAETGPV